MEKDKTTLKPNPLEKTGILSKVTFAWLIPLFLKGMKTPVEKEDLFETRHEDTSADLGDHIAKNWDKEIIAAKDANRKPSFIRALCKGFGFSYALIGVYALIEECFLKIIQPLLLGGLIRYFNKEEGYTAEYIAILFALGIVATSFLNIAAYHPYFYGVQNIGMQARIASCSLMYRKALRLSSTALGQTTVGQMVNLLSNDVNRFDTSVIFIHYIWVGPLQTFIVTCILWTYLGPSCLAGIILLILFVPLQSYMGRIFSRLRLATAHRTDERIRIMSEIVNAMRVIKMYAWEKPFTAMIKEARRKEVDVIMKTNYFRAFNMSMFYTSSKIVVFLAFLTYVLTGNVLTAEKVFVTMALITNVRLSMTLFLPYGVTMGSEMLISCKRIQKFLLMEEKEESDSVEKCSLRPKPKDCSVEAAGICARWIPSSIDDDLKNISFRVKAGQLLAVIGSVGAGKSSLLHTVLSELPIKKGTVKIRGQLAYVSQEPWLFSGTVKQNIIFGQPFNAKKYHQVLNVCALERDLEILPERDQTMVGERGVALSGGQKARINLARAVYFDADVYLLDDPLSAVDAHVGKHLYEECISKYLSHKVCILVTHQLQFIKTADQILVLHDGGVQAQGTYEELSEKGFDFTSLIREDKKEVPKIIEDHQRRKSFQRERNESSHFSKFARLRRDSEAWYSIHGSNSSLQDYGVEGGGSIMEMMGGGSTLGLGGDIEEVEEPSNAKVVEGAEIKTTGTVSMRIYASYFRAGGGVLFLLTLFAMTVITQVLYTGSDYWLSFWTNAEQTSGYSSYENSYNMTNFTIDDSVVQLDRGTYVYVYTGMTVALFILALIRTVMFFMMCMSASRNLHLKMLSSIIRTPIKFFDTHPIGSILNRFAKDIGQIDDLLPATMYDYLEILFTFLGIIAIVAYVNVWIVLPTFLLSLLFFFVRMVYLASARDIKRLEGVTRSPVFSHLSCSLQGLTTIRAMEAQDAFIKTFDDHQDLHTSAWFLYLCTTRVFGVYLDFLAFIYITIVTFSFLGINGEVLGGDVGLAISSAMMLAGMFQWGIRQSAEVENQMTSVERVREYAKLTPESLPSSDKVNKKPGWPCGGKISFQNVSLYYDRNVPPVLLNVSFDIEAGQKIGVVGRTGAGKSSLLTCLFRLTQPDGLILIDGVDTDSIHLSDLRESISIIPQDPTLFNGTIRENLDPFSSHTDEEIWNALEGVELKQPVSEMTGGLSAFVSEGGHNLSIGQRQLVCLARAILKHNKILVMDEATANVDPQTDYNIQQTIRLKFVDCTVLTIAHRLHTIMDSDKVIVMEAGELEEFAAPHELLQDDNSLFSQLIRQTGHETEQHLRSIAEETFYARLHNEKKQFMANLALCAPAPIILETCDSKTKTEISILENENNNRGEEILKEEGSFNNKIMTKYSTEYSSESDDTSASHYETSVISSEGMTDTYDVAANSLNDEENTKL